jgi:ribonuclease BN (tRNA processing enzyme)
VIVANGAAYVIDCGDGVARQLVLAGVPLDTLRHVLLTHHHSDHNADYGARIANEGRVPLAPLVHVHELAGTPGAWRRRRA